MTVPAEPPQAEDTRRVAGELPEEFDELYRTLIGTEAPARRRRGTTVLRSDVGWAGFRGGPAHFDDQRERARRYGEVWTLEDRGPAYLLRLELPRRLPPTSVGDVDLPPRMPAYAVTPRLEGNVLVVHGAVADPHVRRITGVAPAFPSTFTTAVPLPAPVRGFRHRCRDGILEVILPKRDGPRR